VPCFNCVNFLQHFLIEKIIIIAKGKVQKKREPHKKIREEQKAEGAKKRRIKKKNSEVLASF